MSRDLQDYAARVARAARTAAGTLSAADTATKDAALANISRALRARQAWIQEENDRDMRVGRAAGLDDAMLDRLLLSDARIEAMAAGVDEIRALPDPVGAVDGLTTRPNGLQVGRMRIPLGVIAMIFESRPNVTVDASALTLKAGNAVILRGGKEAIHSNLALGAILREALAEAGLPEAAVTVVDRTDRALVPALLQRDEEIDLVIPRGGEGLIRAVVEASRIPVLKHYKGVCHAYVDAGADPDAAVDIIVNAKTQRPGVCNALETLLVDRAEADTFLPRVAEALRAKGVTLRGCPETLQRITGAEPAGEDDWHAEYLDLTLAVRVVADLDASMDHIRRYGSGHSEVILTRDHSRALRFLREVDASCVLINASTRFNDGGQLGLGAEIGISTSKLHAYGPMGLEELTSRKFVVFGEGQVRG